MPGVAVKTIDNRNWRSDMSPKVLRIGVLSSFLLFVIRENKCKKNIANIFLYDNIGSSRRDKLS